MKVDRLVSIIMILLDKKVFSADDLSALLMGLSSLSNMVRGDELVHALAKVKSFIPADSPKGGSTNSLVPPPLRLFIMYQYLFYFSAAFFL